MIAAIGAVHPDVVMIELDEERLEFMRGPSQRPTLQQFHYAVSWLWATGSKRGFSLTMHAVWY